MSFFFTQKKKDEKEVCQRAVGSLLSNPSDVPPEWFERLPRRRLTEGFILTRKDFRCKGGALTELQMPPLGDFVPPCTMKEDEIYFSAQILFILKKLWFFTETNHLLSLPIRRAGGGSRDALRCAPATVKFANSARQSKLQIFLISGVAKAIENVLHDWK